MARKCISKIFINYSFAFIITQILFQSCSDKEFTLDQKFIESKTNVMLIDTFLVSASTVLIDSMPTSGDSVVLIGYCKDEVLGKILVNSYFQIGLPEYNSVQEDDVFDSISLYLSYNNYSYGDTLQNFKFTIHQLIAEPEGDEDGNFYNTSTVAYYPTNLGECSMKPRPIGKSSIEIRLNDELGIDIFNKILESNDIINSEASFLTYFSGIALIADSSFSKSIIGFKTSATALNMRIYYHRFAETLENYTCEFPITNIDKQFNQIVHDFRGTKLDLLFNQRNSVPSIETDNRAFLLGGIGILPKLQFPTLQELLYFQHGIILKAELLFRPEKTSYATYPLPTKLILYEADKYNRFMNPIYDENDNVQVGYFSLDKFYNEGTYYSFDITSYIKSELAGGSYNSDKGLFITTLSSVYTNTITRFILECSNPAPKLKIYYASY